MVRLSSRSLRIAVVAAVVLAAVAGLLMSRAGVDEVEADTAGFVDPVGAYDPVAAGEAVPEGYRPGLARDQILPVYEPVFTPGIAVDWPGDALVVAVAGAETAKAYPVTHLNAREMVIDSLDGIPILVSW